MRDTVLAQLVHADIILLNKTDLVSRDRLDATSHWLGETAPRARIIPSRSATVPLEIVLGQYSRPNSDLALSAHHHTADYQTLSLAIDTPCDPGRLADALTLPEADLLRAKGFVRGVDGTFVTVHVVGRRAVIEPAPAWIEGPARIVCIGLADRIDQTAIAAAIDACSMVGAKS
jgi:G3E family GTPase